MTCNDLKDICKKNRLPVTGKKSDLQDRIKEMKQKRAAKSTCKKVIFEEDRGDVQDIAVDRNAEQKPAPNAFFQNLLKAPPAKKRDATASIKSKRARSVASSIAMRSPKRKRSQDDTDDDAKTPGVTPSKRHRPVAFLTSSPRMAGMDLSPTPSKRARMPLANHNNRAPVMFKHTISTAKKRLDVSDEANPSTLTFSTKKRTQKSMNDAVSRLLDSIDGDSL